MTEETALPSHDVDDLCAPTNGEHHAPAAQAFRIEVADESLNFRTIEVSDPVPLGRQVLQAAGAKPIEEFNLVALVPNGDFEDVRLDETFDIRGRGVERFIYFRTDRSFKFTIDNRQMEWGKPPISGTVLRRLANIQPGYSLYLEVRGGQDREVGPTDVIDLSKPGIERFITVLEQTTEGAEALPIRDREYLEAHGIPYQIAVDGQTSGVVLNGMELPSGKYNQEKADVLCVILAMPISNFA